MWRNLFGHPPASTRRNTISVFIFYYFAITSNSVAQSFVKCVARGDQTELMCTIFMRFAVNSDLILKNAVKWVSTYFLSKPEKVMLFLCCCFDLCMPYIGGNFLLNSGQNQKSKNQKNFHKTLERNVKINFAYYKFFDKIKPLCYAPMYICDVPDGFSKYLPTVFRQNEGMHTRIVQWVLRKYQRRHS